MTEEELKRLMDYKDRGTLNRDEALEYHRLLCIEEGHVTPEPKVEGAVTMTDPGETVVTSSLQPEPPAQEEVKPMLTAEENKEESLMGKVMDKLKGE